LLAPSSGKRSRSVIGLLLSDVHAGEVVSSDEILGLNSFDIEICRRRLRRLFAAACEIGPRWTVDCDNQGVLLTLGGDLVSGDIHEELRITNGLRASLEPPMQWLFLLHERWKLRERVEIQFEEPAIPPLPRVRIPAEMAGRPNRRPLGDTRRPSPGNRNIGRIQVGVLWVL
jgi:hypothetical protein